jgi:hypothetical protein
VALKAIAQRHGANVVLVAVANEAQGGALNIVVNGYNTATGANPLNQNYPVPPGTDRAAALGNVAKAIVDGYEERWKRDNVVVPGGAGAALRVVVPIASYGDWVELRRRLRTVALVRGFQVLELTREQARLSLDYTGDVEQLRVALAQSDLTLAPGVAGTATDAVGGDYTLTLAGGAKPAPANAGAGTDAATPEKPAEGTAPSGPGK